jgi:hypothetical protein
MCLKFLNCFDQVNCKWYENLISSLYFMFSEKYFVIVFLLCLLILYIEFFMMYTLCVFAMSVKNVLS